MDNIYYSETFKIAGLQIDLYDSLWPENYKVIGKVASLPTEVASAEVMSPDKLSIYGDKEFCLIILTKDGRKIRKWPVTDPSNTYVSSRYFIANKDKLPFEAQVVAAKNLKVALVKYNLDVPLEIKQLSEEVYPDAGVGTIKEAKLKKKAGLEEEQIMTDGDFGLIRNCDGNKERMFPITKESEASGYLGKFAEITQHLKSADKLQFAYRLTKKAKALGLAVPEDISKMSALHEKFEKKVLKSTVMGKYPTNTPMQTKVASKYFDAHEAEMDPDTKYKFATELAKTAEKQGVVLKSKGIQKFADNLYDTEKLHDAFTLRRRVLTDKNDEESIKTLNRISKMAGEVSPVVLTRVLSVFDKNTGLDYYWGRSVDKPDAILKVAKEKSYLSYNNILSDKATENINKVIKSRSK